MNVSSYADSKRFYEQLTDNARDSCNELWHCSSRTKNINTTWDQSSCIGASSGDVAASTSPSTLITCTRYGFTAVPSLWRVSSNTAAAHRDRLNKRSGTPRQIRWGPAFKLQGVGRARAISSPHTFRSYHCSSGQAGEKQQPWFDSATILCVLLSTCPATELRGPRSEAQTGLAWHISPFLWLCQKGIAATWIQTT